MAQKFKTFQDILRLIQSKHPEFSRRLNESDAMSRWEESVGPQIAKNARARSVRDGVLWIEVSHPVWRQELQYRKAQILNRLNQSAVEGTAIRDLFFVEVRRSGQKTSDSK